MYLGEKNSLYGLFLKAILLAFLPPHSMLDWSSFSVGLFHKRRRKYIVRQDCNWSIFFPPHLFPTQHHQDHSYIWRCSDALKERKDVRERWKNYHVKLCFLSNSNAYLTALWQIRTLEFLALPNVIKTIPMHFWETFFENLQVRVIIRLIEEGYLLSKVTYFQKSPISKGNVYLSFSSTISRWWWNHFWLSL